MDPKTNQPAPGENTWRLDKPREFKAGYESWSLPAAVQVQFSPKLATQKAQNADGSLSKPRQVYHKTLATFTIPSRRDSNL